MDKIKEIIKGKDFVINNLVLKNIKVFNLSVNELLLLLYFINIDNVLDTNRIESYISLDESEIFESFDGLSKKGIIEIVVKKHNGLIEEEISLENFYNKLVINLPEESKASDIYTEFEKEFGRTLSPIEYETISKWLDNNISETMIKNALKEAVLNGVSNLRYIDKIIYEWTKKEYKTKSIESDNSSTKVFDYNWLDDETK